MRFLPAIIVLLLPALPILADPVVLPLPDDSRELANQAKVSFDQGRYLDAQKLYEQIVQKHPDNLYALSNLGVVYFRNQKWKLAEATLRKAVAIAPGDAFSHFTLGVILSHERLSDEAHKEFNTALALDPKRYSDSNEYISAIQTVIGPVKPSLPPIGDFDTQHERQLRQSPLSPADSGSIGLSPGRF